MINTKLSMASSAISLPFRPLLLPVLLTPLVSVSICDACQGTADAGSDNYGISTRNKSMIYHAQTLI